jgi:hypothetical protein
MHDCLNSLFITKRHKCCICCFDMPYLNKTYLILPLISTDWTHKKTTTYDVGISGPGLGCCYLEYKMNSGIWYMSMYFCKIKQCLNLINRFVPHVICTDVLVNITFISKSIWHSLILVLISVSIFLLADTCKLYTKTEKLERDGCVSVDNVTYNYCAGGCGDSVTFVDYWESCV